MPLTSNDIAVLDDPAWHSLTGPHARCAESIGSAHRHQPDISIFIGVAVEAAPDEEAIVLGPVDAEEMADLVGRAKPGSRRPRTYELGTDLGSRRDGRLRGL